MSASPYEGITRSGSSGSLKKRDFDYKFKIAIIGDSGAGKSCLVSTFVNGKGSFSTTYVKTQVREISTKVVEILGFRVLLELWDLSGADEERTATSYHYASTHGIVVAYSLTCEDSWHNVKNWFDNFRWSIGEDDFSRMPKVLVGTKKDSSYTVLDGSCGDQLSFKLSQATHLTTSSRTGENVSQVFLTIANQLFDTYVRPHLKSADIDDQGHTQSSSQGSPTDELIPHIKKRKLIPCCVLI